MRSKKIRTLLFFLLLKPILFAMLGCENPEKPIPEETFVVELLSEYAQKNTDVEVSGFLAKEIDNNEWLYLRIPENKFNKGDRLKVVGKWIHRYNKLRHPVITTHASTEGDFKTGIPVFDVKEATKNLDELQAEKPDNLKEKPHEEKK